MNVIDRGVGTRLGEVRWREVGGGGYMLGKRSWGGGGEGLRPPVVFHRKNILLILIFVPLLYPLPLKSNAFFYISLLQI